MTAPLPKVAASLQAAYDEQYSEASAAWREVGGKYKVRNLLDVCAGRRFERVLDCGAGEGSLLKFLDAAGAFAELYAVEISDSGLDFIRRRALPTVKEARKFDGYAIPYADKSFDLAYCSHVLEHVEHPRILLRELKRVSAFQAFEVPLDYAIGVDRNTQHLLSYGHINVFTPSLFRFLLKSEGYQILAERLTHVPDEVQRFSLYRNGNRKPTLASELSIRAQPLLNACRKLLRGKRFEEFGYAAYTCLAQGTGELKVYCAMASPKAPRIVEEKGKARAVTQRIRDGLIAYNATKAGPPHYRPLVLSARDSKGKLVGGLSGLLYWNVLYIELLWLKEGARKAGLGRRLMQAAERRARRARKELVFLNSYSFQAPGFYRKLGYRSFGVIRNYPRGATRVFFVKSLV